MKIYVATAFGNRNHAKVVIEELRRRGHEITHDWTNESSVGKSGQELEDYLARCAQSDVDGVANADLVLMLNHSEGRASHAEVGMGIALKKRILVVGIQNAHNIFFHLPHVGRVSDLDTAYSIIDEVHQEMHRAKPKKLLDEKAVNVVLDAVREERRAQDARWGEQNHPIGTSDSFEVEANYYRKECDQAHKLGVLSWKDIILEELYESLAEKNLTAIRKELVQTAAVVVAAIESIDRKLANGQTVDRDC